MLDKKKWQELLKKAKKGDAEAQIDVGLIYSDGYINPKQDVIVKKNNKLAYEWYKKAVEQGSVIGIDFLAYHLDCGIGCERDTKKAIELYKIAINKGSSGAANNLGTIYRDKGNYKKAFEYYDLSMRIAGSDYSLTVGLCYLYGLGVQQDKSVAVRHFRKVSADKLNNQCQFDRDIANYYLGIFYLTGEGLKKSLKLAKKYFELANIDNDNEGALTLSQLIGWTKKA